MATRAELEALLSQATQALADLGIGALGTADELTAALNTVAARDVKIAELAQALADCQDTAPSPGPSGIELQWGDVLYEDLGTTSAAIQPWGNQSTAGYDGYDVTKAAQDPYVKRIAERGLWNPHGKTAPSERFTRLIVPPAPPQAIHDASIASKHWPDAENATTRAHLFSRGWGASGPFTVKEGAHVWYTLGFRVMENPPIIRDIQSGGGNNYNTQLCQWKSRTSSYSGVDAVSVGRNGIHFGLGPHPDQNRFYDPVVCPHGVWHRLAVEQFVSTDPAKGFYQAHVKLNGQAWKAAGPKRPMRNIPAGGWRNFGLGPYHDIRLCTDNGAYHCDYRDIQLISAK